ncbi:NAD(P)H-quinone oxidoreductase [Ahrensia kielensis]|uniref:NAD(P)H-quinone oxidoreductase n=1 Tax=Ahrensia kielensis TaxID=76980 RepID=UPI00037E0952|nr:NAD(P)H-quinone oxidoreductase [Ahrensia kielensis]
MTNTKKMTAVEITEPGGPKALSVCKRDKPQPASHEILIEVRAAGVNRPDVLQRMGAYPPPKGASDLPGLEVAGIVEAVGEDVTRFRVGDSVCALTAGGGYAQYVSVDEGSVLPVPAGLTMTQAAALPETFFTVWHNVFERGGLRKGEVFLVHGGTSGIGTTAIQLAKAIGAIVITTVGSAEKAEACKKLGADHVISYRDEDFVSVVKQVTDGRGADVILDMVGGDYINRNYSCAAMDGRIVQIAFLSGAKTEADFSKLMMKRLIHTGSTLRARPLEVKALLAKQLEEHVWPLIENGQIAPVMDMIFPLAEAWRAHDRMEEGSHIGKIVLDVT